MTNKILYGLLAVMVIAFACASPAADTTTDVPMDDPTDAAPADPMDDVPDEPAAPTDDTAPEESPDMDTGVSEPDVTFQLTGQNFEFQMDGERNPTLTVQQGDLVRIEFESTDGFHDWVIDEFGASTERVRETDGMVAVEFTADQAGEFFYYCGVGSHRAQGMEGLFVVE